MVGLQIAPYIQRDEKNHMDEMNIIQNHNHVLQTFQLFPGFIDEKDSCESYNIK